MTIIIMHVSESTNQTATAALKNMFTCSTNIHNTAMRAITTNIHKVMTSYGNNECRVITLRKEEVIRLFSGIELTGSYGS